MELPARRLSVRDIEEVFRDETGRLPLLRTAVSQIGEQPWADSQELVRRDLSEYDVTCLSMLTFPNRTTSLMAAFVTIPAGGEPARSRATASEMHDCVICLNDRTP